MVYTGAKTRVSIMGNTERDLSITHHCLKMGGTLFAYILLLIFCMMSLPHEVEWDMSHILWPVIPTLLLLSGGFFAMIWYLFGEEFGERMVKKNK